VSAGRFQILTAKNSASCRWIFCDLGSSLDPITLSCCCCGTCVVNVPLVNHEHSTFRHGTFTSLPQTLASDFKLVHPYRLLRSTNVTVELRTFEYVALCSCTCTHVRIFQNSLAICTPRPRFSSYRADGLPTIGYIEEHSGYHEYCSPK
jgi:hypothetical protein